MTPLSIRQLSAIIGNAIRTVPANLCVVGETVDLSSRGGHGYLELIEKDAQGATVARIRATIWANTLYQIRQKFWNATRRDITAGIKVMVTGTVTYHERFGLTFNITDIDPSYTLGDMERIRREIIERLQKEGVLERNKRLTLPPATQRIAVISAEGAAGYGDFIHQLQSTPEHLQFYPLLFPAAMQGDRTSLSIRQALARIEMSIDFWDCVVIIRGGGATSDLNGFDDYDLARAVATFPIPIIVGIGHERDRTVLDEIACIRCKTPTAVATYLIDALRGDLIHCGDLAASLARIADTRIQRASQRLTEIATLIPAAARQQLADAHHRLDITLQMLPQRASAVTSRASAHLDIIAQRLEAATDRVLQRDTQRLQTLTDRLLQNATLPIERQRQQLTRLDDMLRLLSPANTLQRGYSITRHDGKALRNPSSLPPGTLIETQLASGTILSRIESEK